MNCYVLAGGRSRRMGRSKPELFLDRVGAAARGAFDEVIVVDRAFEGPHEHEGPVFGIEAALRHAQQGRCFILAVDYPLITTEVLAFLRDRTGVPVWRGEPQPLCAAYDTALLPLVERRIAGRQFDLRGLIAEAHVGIIEESELRTRFAGEPLLNVNTPHDLEEFHERVLASR
jgi:molybdopterin-guanine dinucleotide biosynthesis protein A